MAEELPIPELASEPVVEAPLPKLSSADYRTYNKMADTMDQFVGAESRHPMAAR